MHKRMQSPTLPLSPYFACFSSSISWNPSKSTPTGMENSATPMAAMAVDTSEPHGVKSHTAHSPAKKIAT